MSPTYTMSAHLCRAVYSSWREIRQPNGEAHHNPLPSPPIGNNQTSYFQRSPSPEKRSMDSDRSDAAPSMSRQSSSSSWKFGGSR